MHLVVKHYSCLAVLLFVFSGFNPMFVAYVVSYAKHMYQYDAELLERTKDRIIMTPPLTNDHSFQPAIDKVCGQEKKACKLFVKMPPLGGEAESTNYKNHHHGFWSS
ncbi:hypothetical protein L2E82_27124 [Cichorium intybus]|uniref:Uncharacterized protein n=1 Tax=Cichorium intybus TaxID=13427 RepID=A0ACB9CS38_CICIN|nr:hypothetical protein L2E82_27124 [Cichorium intybus]